MSLHDLEIVTSKSLLHRLMIDLSEFLEYPCEIALLAEKLCCVKSVSIEVSYPVCHFEKLFHSGHYVSQNLRS